MNEAKAHEYLHKLFEEIVVSGLMRARHINGCEKDTKKVKLALRLSAKEFARKTHRIIHQSLTVALYEQGYTTKDHSYEVFYQRLAKRTIVDGITRIFKERFDGSFSDVDLGWRFVYYAQL